MSLLPAIIDLPARPAMGLPEGYAEQEWSALERAAAGLLAFDPASLAEIAENPDEPFARRHAAGLIAAVAGDRRIVPDSPAMCPVPAGPYRIGVAPGVVDAVVREFAELGVRRPWIEKETPTHQVWLDAFAIGRYPVTNGEYARFLAASGHRPLPSCWRLGVLAAAERNQPVYGITADCADAYAAWLAARTGRGFRLPSEAEWEVAAGGGETIYPWGDEFAPDRANTAEAGLFCATPVGIFPRGASPFGCLDMAGNVEEFVADSYRPYPGGRFVEDDLAAADPAYRIARGGSFTRFRDLARCTRRHGEFRSALYAIGFRLAETLPDGGRG